MREGLSLYVVAGAATVATIASSVLDIILAARISDTSRFTALRILLFTAFALQVIALGCLSYYCLLFIRISIQKRIAWVDSTGGAGFNTVSLAVTGTALIWLVCEPDSLQSKETALRDTGLTLWAATLVLHFVFFVLLADCTRKILSRNVPRVQVTNEQFSPTPTKGLDTLNRQSFCSRDTTLASRPCTPASSRTFSLRSSTTRVASSLRSKYARSSARSSIELPPFPAGEATSLGNAFDRYDTSSMSPDLRNTIMCSSPNMARPGLEPIPGSRPSTPIEMSHAESTIQNAPATTQQQHSPNRDDPNPFASRPASISSPPNFSRPTSKAYGQAAPSVTIRQPRSSASMTELIHPLFRPDSPSLPQILTSNTMVTASPLANQPITPKTLSRLRSGSDLRTKYDAKKASTAADQPPLPSTGQWSVMPSADYQLPRPRSKSHSSAVIQKRPGTAGSESTENMQVFRVHQDGSPGPSVVEEDELPPILPGFVLSAGSRRSLVGYGKRKSMKRTSAHLE